MNDETSKESSEVDKVKDQPSPSGDAEPQEDQQKKPAAEARKAKDAEKGEERPQPREAEDSKDDESRKDPEPEQAKAASKDDGNGESKDVAVTDDADENGQELVDSQEDGSPDPGPADDTSGSDNSDRNFWIALVVIIAVLGVLAIMSRID